MFEFTICAYNDEKIIDKLYALLCGNIKAENGLIIKQQIKNLYNISLAVENSKKEYAIGLILDAICDAIIYCYKLQFFRERIDIQNSIKNFDKLIWAIITFDIATDKNLIKKEINLGHKINITSLYKFRLFALKKRWEDVCEIVSNNIYSILSANTVDDIMRDFVVTSENKIENLHIFANKTEIVVKIDDKCSDLVFLYDNNYYDNLICEIISLNPKKIFLHGKNEKFKHIEKTLAQMFVIVYEN